MPPPVAGGVTGRFARSVVPIPATTPVSVGNAPVPAVVPPVVLVFVGNAPVVSVAPDPADVGNPPLEDGAVVPVSVLPCALAA